MLIASPFLQGPNDLFAGDHRLPVGTSDRVCEGLLQCAPLRFEFIHVQHAKGLGVPLEGVPDLPQFVRSDLLVRQLVEKRADMPLLPWSHREALLPEVLVCQAMLPQRPEPSRSRASFRKSSPRMSFRWGMCSANGTR